MKMEQTSTYEDGTKCSETSAYKIQMPCNYPEESIQHPSSNLLIMHAVLNYFAICMQTLQENYE